MAPEPQVRRANDVKDDRMAMLAELAKLTKPTGPSSRDEVDVD